ncbi:PstS family phosphate ABC transporter substrate-binding protein [Mesoterricola silvestris]|uniref:Phosphate ABC transporter substrate-binding protein n=1 Tax=Mesoterricola silvestris TaxID=2927979 RepID=A0AA48GIS6_9BACT|nr:substrate-binding domain-containing protein [Mesoterricola silvestris]BDU72057.1 phosphate ABC transporter substrate-binding protein [Mesoterricola silvestris]
MKCLAFCTLLSMGFLLSARTPAPGDPLLAATPTNMESTFLLWRDAYRLRDTEIQMNVQPMVAAMVARNFIDGTAQLAGMNRDLKPEEVSAFTARWGYPPTRITVGLNALVVMVHKQNPIQKVKVEQLDAAWSTTRLLKWPGDAATWGDLGVTDRAWKARPILRVGRPEGAGLRDDFIHTILKDGKPKADTRHGVDGMEVYRMVLAEPGAMGYGDLSEIYEGVRPLPIVPQGGSAAVAPTAATVADGSYPFVRGIYIYLNKAPGKALNPRITAFMEFVLSQDGQNQVRLNGMVPLPPDLVRGNLRRVATQ